MTVDEVLAEVEQDSSFYAESGGGITVSGGECLMSPEFVSALLTEAHNRGITTAIETASNVPYSNFQKVLPHVDYVYHDIKNMDSAAHQHWSGVAALPLTCENGEAILSISEKGWKVTEVAVIPVKGRGGAGVGFHLSVNGETALLSATGFVRGKKAVRAEKRSKASAKGSGSDVTPAG